MTFGSIDRHSTPRPAGHDRHERGDEGAKGADPCKGGKPVVKPADPVETANSVTRNPEAVAIAKTAKDLPPQEAAKVIEASAQGMTPEQKKDVYTEVVTQVPDEQVAEIAEKTADPENVKTLKEAVGTYGSPWLQGEIGRMTQVLWSTGNRATSQATMVWKSEREIAREARPEADDPALTGRHADRAAAAEARVARDEQQALEASARRTRELADDTRDA